MSVDLPDIPGDKPPPLANERRMMFIISALIFVFAVLTIWNVGMAIRHSFDDIESTVTPAESVTPQ